MVDFFAIRCIRMFSFLCDSLLSDYSERLFLINPTMGGDSDSWHRPSWGSSNTTTLGRRPCLCTVTELQWRKASDMVSDQAVLNPDAPHEGCRIATQPPAIVGLMRNRLSKALVRSFNRVSASLRCDCLTKRLDKTSGQIDWIKRLDDFC